MTVFVYLGTALLVMVVALCLLLYTRLSALQGQFKSHRAQLDRIEVGLHTIADSQEFLMKRTEQLATDVLQREIYQNADNRHQNAIKDAKAGFDVSHLVQRHGLSFDEASLMHALHGVKKPIRKSEAEIEGSSSPDWYSEV